MARSKVPSSSESSSKTCYKSYTSSKQRKEQASNEKTSDSQEGGSSETKTTETKPKTSPPASSKRGTKVDVNPKKPKQAKVKASNVKKAKVTERKLNEKVWTEDQEIVLMENMVEFFKNEGVNPADDLSVFLKIMENKVPFDLNKERLRGKIRRLKGKFMNLVAKGKIGEDEEFSSAHDQKLFDLSKILWGEKCLVKINPKRSCEETACKADEFGKHFGVGGVTEEFIVRKGLEKVNERKRDEMEKKWRDLNNEALELFIKRKELVNEQAKLMLDAYKNE